MSNIVVIGAQWGDEGKGKVVDLLTREVDAIVRFQGGNNAGHTLVVKDRKLVLHLIPSGILHSGKICLIGNGVVLDPEVFCNELDTLTKQGVDTSPSRLKVSRKTHIIMPYHKLLDSAREAAKKDGKIGTTGRGIGPCYEDKAGRTGIRAADLADPQLLRRKIVNALAEKNALFALYGAQTMDADEVFEQVRPYAERVTGYLADVSSEIQQRLESGKGVLFEGAQGTHLDIDHGTYPFVTSSICVAGNASAGAGCSPRVLDRIVAIVKAYTTRVGSGPFPTELSDETGEFLQSRGHEFGATTGRKRRCGWLDICILRESARLNGPTDICVTKLDVLDGLKTLKLCVKYRYQGEEYAYPPQAENALAAVEPIYEVMPGWDEDTSAVRTWEELPENARRYLLRVEELLGVPVTMISVGPDRDQVIRR